MNRFNNKIGAITLVGLAAIYMILSLAMGKSAASQPPPDFSTAEAKVDVWQATAMLAKHGDSAVIVDTRSANHFGLYHLPRAISKPGVGASGVLDAAKGKAAVLVVGETNEEASKLAGQVAQAQKDIEVRFLDQGVRAWYLTYEVPTPLFNEKAPPYGWEGAMATVRAFVSEGKGSEKDVVEALGTLSSAGYAPTQLEGKKKPAQGGAKKKIAGGCG